MEKRRVYTPHAEKIMQSVRSAGWWGSDWSNGLAGKLVRRLLRYSSCELVLWGSGSWGRSRTVRKHKGSGMSAVVAVNKQRLVVMSRHVDTSDSDRACNREHWSAVTRCIKEFKTLIFNLKPGCSQYDRDNVSGIDLTDSTTTDLRVVGNIWNIKLRLQGSWAFRLDIFCSKIRTRYDGPIFSRVILTIKSPQSISGLNGDHDWNWELRWLHTMAVKSTVRPGMEKRTFW
jgi:hypothetical protein